MTGSDRGLPRRAPAPPPASGKVRELYAVGDDHVLLVATDRISAYDHVLPTAIPDKGAVLTALTCGGSGSSPTSCRTTSCRPPSRTTRPSWRPTPSAARAVDAVPPAGDGAGRVRRPRLPGRLEWARTTADRRRCAGSRLPAGLQEGVPAAGADLHAGDQGRAGRPRRERDVRRRRRPRRRGDRRPSCAG